MCRFMDRVMLKRKRFLTFLGKNTLGFIEYIQFYVSYHDALGVMT